MDADIQDLFDSLARVEKRARHAREMFTTGGVINGRTALADIEVEARYAMERAKERDDPAFDAPDQWELAR